MARGLDFVLAEAPKYGIKVTPVFLNLWKKNGGVPKFEEWCGGAGRCGRLGKGVLIMHVCAALVLSPIHCSALPALTVVQITRLPTASSPPPWPSHSPLPGAAQRASTPSPAPTLTCGPSPC